MALVILHQASSIKHQASSEQGGWDFSGSALGR
jgi:hypothetical protein